jgi:hypothetical protein
MPHLGGVSELNPQDQPEQALSANPVRQGGQLLADHNSVTKSQESLGNSATRHLY